MQHNLGNFWNSYYSYYSCLTNRSFYMRTLSLTMDMIKRELALSYPCFNCLSENYQIYWFIGYLLFSYYINKLGYKHYVEQNSNKFHQKWLVLHSVRQNIVSQFHSTLPLNVLIFATQWNLSKAGNFGAKKPVRFRQMSAL